MAALTRVAGAAALILMATSQWPATVPPLRAQAATLAPTRTAVALESPVAPEGRDVGVTAFVAAAAPDTSSSPSGVVDFYDADILIGTAPLSTVQQQTGATILVRLAAGVHPIIAKYRGDATFALSYSVPPEPLEVVALPSGTP